MRVFILSIILIIHFTSNNSSNAYKTLSEKSFQLLANTSSSSLFTDFLPSLLIPRVPGTENNTKVNSFIVNKFTELKWHVETDDFTDNTPYGQINFSNIIVTKDIKATKRLVFAAHFDSKYFDHQEFVGATDSAVPCAMLMELAYSLDKYLDKRKQEDATLQIIFFDGEEAFKYWTHDDSIYGSRHLAAKWEDTYIIDIESPQNKGKNMLSGIDVLILLDLLGASRPTLNNYFTTTSWMFSQLIQIESRLTTNNLIKLPGSVTSSSKDGKFEIKENNIDDSLEDHESYFNQYSMNTYQPHIEDDHIPFLMRGVPVLHIIPSPFPIVWHQLSVKYLDMDANILKANNHDELKKSPDN
ncbi:3923_t:CDS:2 [Funneliformis geosporum]|nr:3923_t:CDS:2 [Funneliformis geosporum]